MSYLRFRLGPLVRIKRVGRTQAQKRAATRAAEQCRARRHITGVGGTVVDAGRPVKVKVIDPLDLAASIWMVGETYELTTGGSFQVGQEVEVTWRAGDKRNVKAVAGGLRRWRPGGRRMRDSDPGR